MALIIYPLTDWNSFVSVADADTIIGGFVTDGGYSDLEDTKKEAILRQTALQVKLCSSIELPNAVESDLELAQCYLTVHALTTDMLSFDGNSKSIVEEKVGSLGVKYDAGYRTADSSDFPSIVNSLLVQYGCTKSNSGFSQATLERS